MGPKGELEFGDHGEREDDDGALLPEELAEFWERTEKLARDKPFCYGSQQSAHQDAARAVGMAEKLRDADLAAWKDFYMSRTRNMSRYVGD